MRFSSTAAYWPARPIWERSLAASFDRYTRVINDPLVNNYINRLAQKIVGNSDAAIPFTIKIIDSGDIPES